MSLNTTEELLEDLRAGRMIILMDDEDRENEGDFVIAADCVTAQAINFMARFGRGLICLTLTRDHCRKLNLPLMARNVFSTNSTNFTVSIEAAEGVTTGISAADRAHTIKTAVATDARPSDLVQPGHVFPLMALKGGVLSRAGHTEAGCDLAQLAGYHPAAAIVEILNDDGTMARRSDLEQLARQHELKIGTIADLIRYRTEHERSIVRVAENSITTQFGTFRLVAYQDSIDNNVHLAMVKGDIDPEVPILVRVHLENLIFDLAGGLTGQDRWGLRDVLTRIGDAPNGVVVILSNQIEADAIIEDIRTLNQNHNGTVRRSKDKSSKDLRNIGLGSQILSDLGVRKMVVMSSPKKLHALSGFGLEVVDYVSK